MTTMTTNKFHWTGEPGERSACAKLHDGPQVKKFADIKQVNNERSWNLRIWQTKPADGEFQKTDQISLQGFHQDARANGDQIGTLYALLSDAINNRTTRGSYRAVSENDAKFLDSLVISDPADAASLMRALGNAVENGLDTSEILSRLSEPEIDRMERLSIHATYQRRQRALSAFRTMIDDADLLEKHFQRFLSSHWWMFGSGYTELLDRRVLSRDSQLDYVLRTTADNYLEVVEIKTPLSGHSPMNDSDQGAYPASHLAKALGQMSRYLVELDRDLDAIRARDNEDPLRVKGKIVIGRSTVGTREAIRALNGHLHRIEVLTFDHIVSSAERVLELTSEAISE